MESTDLTDDELRATHRHAQFMSEAASRAGEADAEALFASIVRTCQNEARIRNEGRDSARKLVL